MESVSVLPKGPLAVRLAGLLAETRGPFQNESYYSGIRLILELFFKQPSHFGFSFGRTLRSL